MIDPSLFLTLDARQLEITITSMERALSIARERLQVERGRDHRALDDAERQKRAHAAVEKLAIAKPHLIERLGNRRLASARNSRIVALAAMLPSQAAVARAIGTSESTVSRVLKKQDYFKKNGREYGR